MAHHAKIENGIVTRVIVTCDSDEDTFADRMFAETGEQWVRTSYNGKIRYNFAGVGMKYDKEADAFIAPKPDCGHKELFLNDLFIWNCQRCELDMKRDLINE